MVNVFETLPTTPCAAVASDASPLEDWNSLRDSHISPLYVSSYAGAEVYREEFLAGCHAMGLTSKGKTLKPQQLVVADACNAVNEDGNPLNPFMGLLIPRRSSKTTTVIALAIGRALKREDYIIGVTFATTGAKVRQRFMADVFVPLERMFPDEATRPFKIRRSQGSEQIVFDTGSRILILVPQSDAFRSESFNLVIVDESGEADVAMGEDLLAGILPTMDTNPDSQLLICGTAAKYRAGNLLWDALSDGRDGKAGSGIVEYAAPEFTTAEDTETWELTEPIVRAAHPGIDTLTTIEAIHRNFDKLPRAQFIREYLSIFADVGATLGIIRAEKWAAGELDEDQPEPPEHFTIGISAAPNQAKASIVAAWREDGVGRLLMLENRAGVKWLAPRAIELARKYKVAIAHDTAGVVLVEVETLQRAKPRPRLAPQTLNNVKTAAALLVKELDTGNVKHYGQTEFSAQAAIVKKRMIGPTAWAFGRSDADDDITAIEAASIALRTYDGTPVRGRVSIITANGS